MEEDEKFVRGAVEVELEGAVLVCDAGEEQGGDAFALFSAGFGKELAVPGEEGLEAVVIGEGYAGGAGEGGVEVFGGGEDGERVMGVLFEEFFAEVTSTFDECVGV